MDKSIRNLSIVALASSLLFSGIASAASLVVTNKRGEVKYVDKKSQISFEELKDSDICYVGDRKKDVVSLVDQSIQRYNAAGGGLIASQYRITSVSRPYNTALMEGVYEIRLAFVSNGREYTDELYIYQCRR